MRHREQGPPQTTTLPWTENVPAKTVVVASQQTRGWEDEPLDPLAGGSAPGSNQEVGTTSGQLSFPISYRMWAPLPGDIKAQPPDQTLEGVA